MFAKSIVALATAAALTEQALAVNHHRHLHQRQAEEKRDVEPVVVIETAYTTVYVDAPQATQAPSAGFVADVRPSEEPEEYWTTVTSTSTLVFDGNNKAAAPPAYQPPPPAEVPDAPQTTLATYVKPAPQPAPSSPGEVAPPVKTSAAAPPPPPATTLASGGSAGSPGLSNKRGLAYNSAQLANTFHDQSSGCGWAYNWGSSPQGLDSNISFVPMLWGDRSMFTDHWASDAQKAIDGGAKAMFSFNEPDMGEQANMTPAQAVAAHAKYLNQYSGKVQIGSPSVTNSGEAGKGLEWLKSFMSACKQPGSNCRVDFCNVHWYSQPQYADTLFDHLEKAHAICEGKPVWLTEFAPVDNAGQPVEASAFLKQVMPKLDQLSYLHGYAPFMCSAGKLMSSDSELSQTGKVYAGLS